MTRSSLPALLAAIGLAVPFVWRVPPEPSLVAAAAQSAAPQTTFRAGVDLVQVDVSVLDKNRRPVRGLTISDFTLLDEGKPRPIVAFSAVDLPERADVTLAPWTRDVPADVSTNSLPEEGRLVVILMDRTIQDGQATVTARTIAKAAVRELGPGDLAAVVSTGNGIPHDFTNDRARLLAAIDGSYPAAELSPEANELSDTLAADLYADMGRPPPAAMMALRFSSECLCGACVMDAIARIADAVKDIPRRRKSLLFIGSDLQIETTDNICMDPVRKAREVMFRSLDLANLTVHSLDPLGLESLGARASSRIVAYRGRENLVRQGNIEVLPDRTGGRTVLNTNNPTARVPEIFRESDSYYLLGFEPAVTDSRRHGITVKVNRRGLDVRTRHAYIANPAPPAATPSNDTASVRDVMTGVIPKRDGVTISANAAVFDVPATHQPVVALALHVTHEASAQPATQASQAEQVDVVTGVFSMLGRPLGALQQTLSVTPQTGTTGTVSYDVLQRIPAKPGRYELRVGLRNTARHQTGSVFVFVDVPDYRKSGLALTQVALYAPMGRPAMKDSLADVLLAPSTARREFDRRERVSAFLRVYEGASGPLTSVTLSSRIVDESDRRKFEQQAALPAAEFQGARMADYAVDLPLAELGAGSFLLTIEARAPGFTARRDVRFTVK